MSGVEDTLERLAQTGLPLAITGSLALHLLTGNIQERINDVDVVTPAFSSVPSAVGRHFWCIHVHPFATDGRLLLQLVDIQHGLRIDIFQAVGATMQRARPVKIGASLLEAVSVEDLAARAVRHLLTLERGLEVPRKVAAAARITVPLVEPQHVERAWNDHRPSDVTESFSRAAERAFRLVETRKHLLVNDVYTSDTEAVCKRCCFDSTFPETSKRRIVEVLGYC